jgi:two-component system cell cycle sensor histidine kinase/response regulator CckA
MKEAKDFIMPPDATGPHEMELNPLTLAFPGDLENLFLEDFYTTALPMIRLSLLSAMFLYGFFGILDAQLVPALKEKLFFIRFAIVWPVLVSVIAFSFTSIFKKYSQQASAFALIVAGGGIIAMIAIIPPPVNHSYYAGLILVFIWGYTFGRMRFVWATAAGWIIVAFYEIVAIAVTETPVSILIGNNFFFISANIIGMFACYSIEYYARRDFFLAMHLEKEKAIIRDVNQKLELIIQERTSQLLKTNVDLRQEIEERKRAEEKREELEFRLKQVEKMEAMGTLAGGIAHDFNNLLMGIQGNASLVLLALEADHPFYDKLKTVQDLVRSGADLTKQLLGFARGGKYQAKPTNLNELVRKSSQMFGRTKKELSIFTNMAEKLWIVDVDQSQIEQVLLNLFVNAWQAMPGGGKLFVTTENVSLSADYGALHDLKAGKYVKISITDTGIGMDKATIQRIFDPFFTTKEMGRGTGLGLASAYGIIKNHDGMITVYSEKGHGATFNVFIPASPRQDIEEEKKPQQELRRGEETIMLVDDEETNILVTSNILVTLGYKTYVARNGVDALSLYKNKKDEIDLIILDMIMPGMSGGDVYDQVKLINPEIKVLLSSGYSVTGEAAQILERGCNGFIQKPFEIEELSTKVRQILDTGSA